MPKFVIDRFKDQKEDAIAEAEFVDGQAKVAGEDTDAVEELSEILSSPYTTLRAAKLEGVSISGTELIELQPGSEEHFLTVIHDLPKYGYKARETA